jgi:hypothetical protein
MGKKSRHKRERKELQLLKDAYLAASSPAPKKARSEANPAPNVGAKPEPQSDASEGQKKRLYKYVGPASIEKVFSSPEVVTIKCGYPSEFNDPYELFLTMDFTEKPEMIAFYSDVVGKLPQLPTTCFSLSPAVLPMWAHYASNLEGFVIEFDEHELSDNFPESGFGSVDYADEPSDAVADHLYRAYAIGKFRYMHFLRQSVFSAAYYTKQSCWAYENERRMVASEGEVKKLGGLTLLDVPVGSIKSIICGPRASGEIEERLRQASQAVGCQFLKMRIGRSTGVPFFDAVSGEKFVFSSSGLVQADATCEGCGEPVKKDLGSCSWCLINDSHKNDAAMRNSFRMLQSYGLLDQYMEGVADIDRKRRR